LKQQEKIQRADQEESKYDTEKVFEKNDSKIFEKGNKFSKYQNFFEDKENIHPNLDQ